MRNSFGEILTGLMIETNTSTQQLATELNVTVQNINLWKRNRISVTLSNLVALCDFFGCSLDYLVGRTDNDTKPNIRMLKNFGKCVRDIMKSKGISTYLIRKETHFGSRYFERWDKGADPKLSTLVELADYFKCSLDELVGFE